MPGRSAPNTNAGAGSGAGAGSQPAQTGSRKRARPEGAGGDDLVTEDDWVAGDGSDSDAGAGFRVDHDSDADSDAEVVDIKSASNPTEQQPLAEAGDVEKPPAKKKRRKKKAKGRLHKPGDPADAAIGDEKTAAACVWSSFCNSIGKDMTELERGAPVPASAFIATPSIERTTPNFAAFVRQCVPAYRMSIMWSKHAIRVPRRPTVVVVCSSARRCVELLKPLTQFKTRVAKLFAKRMSVAQQAQLLQSGDVTLAVGTPARIRKLADTGALVFGKGRPGDEATAPGGVALPRQVVVLDMVRDAKTLTLLERRETCTETMQLFHDHLQEPAFAGDLKLALF